MIIKLIIFSVILYLIIGLFIMMTEWKDIERENADFQKHSRKERICIRVAVILTWPLAIVVMFYTLCKIVITRIWEALTE
jgi:hypothetical protein